MFPSARYPHGAAITIHHATSSTAIATARALVKVLRPYQWTKNVLVFAPLLAAHQFTNLDALRQSILAFAAFCLAASAGYVFNDVFDVNADRAHPEKSTRPFASGALSRRWALVLIPLLLSGAAAVALALPAAFGLVLGAYLALSTAYTLSLKHLALIDVVTLAALYTIRLFGGSVATGIVLSNWLLAFSMFLFLSLALVKRVAELRLMAATAGADPRGRGYHVSDVDVLGRMGLSSGYLAVLVLALHINSPDVLIFYRRPEWLWFLCVLLFLWISRMWLKTDRNEMRDDPVVFALRDTGSYWIAALSGFVFFFAS